MLNFMFKPKIPRFRFFIGDMMDHFLSVALLRDVIPKNGQNSPTIFGGPFSVWYQNQNYPSRCTTCHIKFGSGTKTRVKVANSSFGSENMTFDYIDTRLYRSLGLRDGNLFYCRPIWPRLVVIHKKRNFWNRINSHAEIIKNLIFSQVPKKPCAPTCPPILMVSPKNMNKNGAENQKISASFFDLGKIQF